MRITSKEINECMNAYIHTHIFWIRLNNIVEGTKENVFKRNYGFLICNQLLKYINKFVKSNDGMKPGFAQERRTYSFKNPFKRYITV